MGVFHSGADVGVTEMVLDVREGHAGLAELGRYGVPAGVVKAELPREPSLGSHFLPESF